MQTPVMIDTAVSFDRYTGEPDRDGIQGAEILEDGRVHFRLIAPNAKEVAIDRFGTLFPMTKTEDGAWEGTFDLGRGFKYFFVKIDGADVLEPYFPIGYGCCRPMNFVDVPVPEDDWDGMEDVPHGAAARRYYRSSVTGKWESCIVYTPAGFGTGKKYPVLYLQHGYGENETGWVYQGHVLRIADNLLAAGKMPEMLIVMGNGMAQSGDIRDNTVFPKILLNDLIPFIEANYPVYTDREHRAMAGLSMGSYQTSMVTMSHPELFAYAGVFSGFISAPWHGGEESHLAILQEAERFNSSFRVFYRAMGTEDGFFKRFEEDDRLLEGKGLNIIRRTFSGEHDWTVWRRCIHEFLQLIFR